MSTNCTAGEGASWPRRWATSMVLPNPASPPTTDPETSASRTMTRLLSSAHPSHQAVSDSGGVLVVGQSGAGDGGHSGGHALVIGDELGGWEAVLAGPVVLVAEPQGLG